MDRSLQGLRAAIKLNKWDCDIVKPYKPIKDELTVTSQGLVLRGTRIVMPQSLQQRAIDIAHDTHLGLSKTKAERKDMVPEHRSTSEENVRWMYTLPSRG